MSVVSSQSKKHLTSAISKPVPMDSMMPGQGATLAGVLVPAYMRKVPLSVHLGVSTDSVDRWIREQGFPRPVVVGPKVRLFSTVEVQKWLDSRSGKSEQTQQTLKGADQ